MVIYKDYTGSSLLFNKPCKIDDKCIVYPISIKDYDKFIKYANYLTISRKQLNLADESELLRNVIIISIASINNGSIDLTDNNSIICMNKVLNDLCELFTILTRVKLKHKISKNGGFEFVGEGIVIDDNNYDNLRDVALKISLLKEPKVFKDKLTQKWYNKALIAKQKNQPNLELEDIITIVSQDMKIPFEKMEEMNIVQLYTYYCRITARDNYDKIMNFKLVSDKMPNVSFSDSIIEKLYKDDDSDMYIDGSSLSKMVT